MKPFSPNRIERAIPYALAPFAIILATIFIVGVYQDTIAPSHIQIGYIGFIFYLSIWGLIILAQAIQDRRLAKKLAHNPLPIPPPSPHHDPLCSHCFAPNLPLTPAGFSFLCPSCLAFAQSLPNPLQGPAQSYHPSHPNHHLFLASQSLQSLQSPQS